MAAGLNPLHVKIKTKKNMKEASHKGMHVLCVDVCDILEKAKLKKQKTPVLEAKERWISVLWGWREF